MAQHGMDWEAINEERKVSLVIAEVARARCLCGEFSAVGFDVDGRGMWRWLANHLLDVIKALESPNAG